MSPEDSTFFAQYNGFATRTSLGKQLDALKRHNFYVLFLLVIVVVTVILDFLAPVCIDDLVPEIVAETIRCQRSVRNKCDGQRANASLVCIAHVMQTFKDRIAQRRGLLRRDRQNLAERVEKGGKGVLERGRRMKFGGVNQRVTECRYLGRALFDSIE